MISRYLKWLRNARLGLVYALVVALLSMALAINSYPFQPQGALLTIVLMAAPATALRVIGYAVQTSRDEITSRITKSTPNRFTMDREFVMTMATMVVPLLGMLALSYGASNLIRSWFEPLFR